MGRFKKKIKKPINRPVQDGNIILDEFPVFSHSLNSEPIRYYNYVTREYHEADPYRKRRGNFKYGYVKCCPKWYAETEARIKELFKKNNIKSKKQISRAIDVVMYILRAQTINKCFEIKHFFKNPNNDKWINISYFWFGKAFFHSKSACVKTLRILREAEILLTDHSWVNVPSTEEERERSGWELHGDGINGVGEPDNRPQGWLVNYHPKTQPEDWVDIPVNFDRIEFKGMICRKAEMIESIDAGRDDMLLRIDPNAVAKCLEDGTISPSQMLRDISLCRKYATRDSWKNPMPKLNKDGSMSKNQRRSTDMREYHAPAMVSKKFLYNCLTGVKGSKYDGARLQEVCDLHTGVIASTLLADIIQKREMASFMSNGAIGSIPSFKELKPVFDALDHLQSRRVKMNMDGTMSITRDGDVYVDAVREIERSVEENPIFREYLGDFFAGCTTDDEKRELVKPYFLMTAYIDENTREKRRQLSLRPPKLPPTLKKDSRRRQRVISAMVCSLFFNMLKREFPEFSEIITKTYPLKSQKTLQYDAMSKGESILIGFISKFLKEKYDISTIRKHDAILTFVDPHNEKEKQLFDPKIGKFIRENIIWDATLNFTKKFST